MLHLCQFLRELLINGPIKEEYLEPTILNMDSTSAIPLFPKSKVTEGDNHMEIKVPTIKELVSNKVIKWTIPAPITNSQIY